MSSRPGRQERIQEDLDELLRQSATLAKALLTRNGEFFPFGATIGKRGKFALVTPLPESDSPTAQDVIDLIHQDLDSSRVSLRAWSLTAMATTASGTDAVRIELEHAEGSSLAIALPYSREAYGMCVYGEMEAHRVPRRIWADDAPKEPRKAPGPAKASPKGTSKDAVHTPKTSPKGAPRTRKTAAGSTGREPAPRKEKPSPHRASRPPQKVLQSQPALF